MQRWSREEIEARALDVTGNSKDAAALRLKIQQEKEYREAEKSGLDAATLARLREVQAMEAAKQAADELTSSMLNVPEGFRVAAAAFRAQDPWTPPPAEPLPPPPVPPEPPSPPGGGTWSPPGGGGPDGTQFYSIAPDTPVVLTLDGEVVANTVIRHARRKASRQFGDATRWGEVS
jgi:hypothetical protein